MRGSALTIRAGALLAEILVRDLQNRSYSKINLAGDRATWTNTMENGRLGEGKV